MNQTSETLIFYRTCVDKLSGTNASISDLLDPTNRIKSLIEKYNNGELNQDSAFDSIE